MDADASAAIGEGIRLGINEVRLFEVNQRWLQDAVYTGKIRMQKVRTEDDL